MQTTTARPARMKNPAVIMPEAMKPIHALYAAAGRGGVPAATLELVHLRASQVNGCSACMDSGWRAATTNFFNRLNVTTRQPAGAWG